MNKRYFFQIVLIGLVGGLLLTACQPKKESDSARLEVKTSTGQPKLVMENPAIMDLTSSQKKPAVLKAAADPNAIFTLHKIAQAEPQIERNGSKFDAWTQISRQKLKLRGTTVRKYDISAISLLTIYTVALYLPEKTVVTEAGDIPDVTQVLILDYHLDVPKEKVVEAIKENVYANPKVEAKKVEKYFNQLADAFDSPKKGDRYEFVYIPGKGTVMMKAGRVMVRIPTRAFADAFFGIWLSPHGKDVQMRCELLAIPCPDNGLSLNPVNLIASPIGGAKEKLGSVKDKLKNIF